MEHYNNTLTVTSSPETREKIMTLLSGSASQQTIKPLNFNNITPMPQDICDFIGLEKLESDAKKNRPFCDIEEKAMELYRDYYSNNGFSGPHIGVNIEERYIRMVKNYQKYGAVDEYDWAVKNWGCLNPYNQLPTRITQDMDLVYEFYTINHPPIKAIETLSKMFKDAKVTLIWLLEPGSSYKSVVLKNGQYI